MVLCFPRERRKLVHPRVSLEWRLTSQVQPKMWIAHGSDVHSPAPSVCPEKWGLSPHRFAGAEAGAVLSWALPSVAE